MKSPKPRKDCTAPVTEWDPELGDGNPEYPYQSDMTFQK